MMMADARATIESLLIDGLVKNALLNDGYCVLHGVLNKEECREALELCWDYVEETSCMRCKRGKPESWFPQRKDDQGDPACMHSSSEGDNTEGNDPWPYTAGWASFKDMFQDCHAGFLHGRVRELVAERVFAKQVFGHSNLHSSKEGFTFFRAAQIRSHPFVCGRETIHSVGEHFDQGFAHAGMQHVQASVAFTDQSPSTGSFLCWPRSHTLHAQLTKDTYRGKQEWVPLTDAELSVMREAGLEAKRVYVNAGDVILWRSDLVHAAAPPVETPSSDDPVGPEQLTSEQRSQFRAVAYMGMLPAELTPVEVVEQKLEAYLRIKTGDHKADQEHWHDAENEEDVLSISKRSNDKTEKTEKTEKRKKRKGAFWYLKGRFFKSAPPQLSWRLAELYGLVPYNLADFDARVAAARRAVANGVQLLPHVLAELGICSSPLVRWTPWSSHARNTHKEEVGGATVEVLGGPLEGKSKWLGGVGSPCGQFVYGVPGNAPDTLCVHLNTGQVERLGGEGFDKWGKAKGPFPGNFKWLRGIGVPAEVMGAEEYPNGCCFGFPSNADKVLKIDPTPGAANNGISTFGGPFKGDWLWHGGNLGSDGCIYAVPCNAEQVLKVNPKTCDAMLIGPVFPGRQKWYGSLVGANGAIYAIPQTATGVLKIVPDTEEVVVINPNSLQGGGWKWHGCVCSEDARYIWGIPNNDDHILEIDTLTDQVTLLGGPEAIESGRHRVPQDQRYKYLGAAIAADGKAYFFPCDAERVLCLDTNTREVYQVGPRLMEGPNKYQNGFRLSDGAVYGIPQRSRGMLRIAPSLTPGGEPIIDELDCCYMDDAEALCKSKFEAGVLTNDGCIICIPLDGSRVVKVTPKR